MTARSSIIEIEVSAGLLHWLKAEAKANARTLEGQIRFVLWQVWMADEPAPSSLPEHPSDAKVASSREQLPIKEDEIWREPGE